ncbi:cell wall protein [Thozetella sp. PMI_491]|nr:cell wall protein [Thozetella sp. PMI_491]
MQFLLLAFAAAVSAQLDIPTKIARSGATPVERDIATISSVVADVGTKLAALDTAVKAFKASDTAALTNLNDAAMKLSTTITSGTTAIAASSNITLNDAITLQSQVSGLQGSGTSLVSDLEGKKGDIQTAGLCDVVLQQVTGINDNAGKLINAIVSKLPEAAQSIAASQTAPFTDSLKQTENAFAAGNCTNGATSVSGGAASNSTATTRPGSSVTAGASAIQAVGPVGALAVAMAVALL